MIKLLIGGSPCTHWSIAQKNNRETEPEGLGWELFKNYLIAKEKFKPDYFLYENNKSAAQPIKDQIAKELGVDLMHINSALVSAQNRQRFYAFNWEVEQPEDRGIVLRDILESGVVDREKSYPLLVSHQGNARDYFKKQHAQIVCEPINIDECHQIESKENYIQYDLSGKQYNSQDQRAYYCDSKHGTLNASSTQSKTGVIEPIRIGDIGSTAQAHRVYSCDGKSVCLKAQAGGQGAKTGLYATPVCHTIPQEVRVRKYTCDIEKFQTLLRESKSNSRLTNKGISIALNRSQTEVEHWFRTDKYFNIPDEDIWFDLKKLLNIKTTEFDDFVTVFETREGVFEKADRCYDVDGKMSTLMTGKTDNIIEPIYELSDEYFKGGKDNNLIGMTTKGEGKYRNGTQPSQQYRLYGCEGKSQVINTLGNENYVVPVDNVGECETVQKAIPKLVDKFGYVPEQFNAYNVAEITDKSPTLSTGSMVTSSCATTIFEKSNKPIYRVKDGLITIKDKQYPIKLADGYYIIRKLTPIECERLQTLPDNYTAAVSNAQRYKGLGNGWTAEVIIHILNGVLKDVPRDEEIVVLSMYDGIGTGRYCLDKMGFTNVKYYAYEIDKYAKQVAMSNYPDIIQMGDAFDLRHPDWTIGY